MNRFFTKEFICELFMLNILNTIKAKLRYKSNILIYRKCNFKVDRTAKIRVKNKVCIARIRDKINSRSSTFIMEKNSRFIIENKFSFYTGCTINLV